MAGYGSLTTLRAHGRDTYETLSIMTEYDTPEVAATAHRYRHRPDQRHTMLFQHRSSQSGQRRSVERIQIYIVINFSAHNCNARCTLCSWSCDEMGFLALIANRVEMFVKYRILH